MSKKQYQRGQYIYHKIHLCIVFFKDCFYERIFHC